MHDTGTEMFVMCLHAHGRLMTYELPVYIYKPQEPHYEYINIRVLLYAQKTDDICTNELPESS